MRIRPTTIQAQQINKIPDQAAADSAYAVKIFLDHHPAAHHSIDLLARQCLISTEQLKKAFLQLFNEPLPHYIERTQWMALK